MTFLASKKARSRNALGVLFLNFATLVVSSIMGNLSSSFILIIVSDKAKNLDTIIFMKEISGIRAQVQVQKLKLICCNGEEIRS
jgi:hypothetical protein